MSASKYATLPSALCTYIVFSFLYNKLRSGFLWRRTVRRFYDSAEYGLLFGLFALDKSERCFAVCYWRPLLLKVFMNFLLKSSGRYRLGKSGDPHYD